MMHLQKSVLISESKIKAAVQRISEQIREDYAGQEIVMICTLKGAVMFFSDLCRALSDFPIEMEFISISSYHGNSYQANTIDITLPVSLSIQNKRVIIVEDILDSGRSMKKLIEELRKHSPASISVATLLKKCRNDSQPVDVKTYFGFEVDGFVVGYGMDSHELYRNLPYVCVLE